MALHIISKKSNGIISEIAWNAGMKRPDINFELERGFVVQSVTADGDELERIIEYFANIPYHKHARVQTWTGEMALFIASHIS